MPVRPILQFGLRIFTALKSWGIARGQPFLTHPPVRARRSVGLFCIGLGSFATLSLGCQPQPDFPSDSPILSRTSNFKVAIVLPATKNDGSWSQAGFEGLRLLEEELSAQTAYREKAGELSQIAQEQLFERYARDGFDFVIGHGGEFLAAIEKVAPKYPRVKFSATTNCPGNNINQGCLTFRSGELGYLTGAIAAMKTQTRKVAFIGGMNYSHMQERAKLFERGAKAIDPELQVNIEWLDSWTDRQKAVEVFKAQIEAGADIIALSAEPAEESIYALARNQQVGLIGWDRDRASLAPNRVITSAIQDVPKLILQGAILVETGRWQGKQYKFGFDRGLQRLAPFRGALTPEEEARVTALREDILTEKIDVLP